MGDISEYRGLIVVVTFLGIFTLLLQLTPTQFFTASESHNVTTPAEFFSVVDIYSFAETATTYLNETHPLYWLNNDYRYWSVDIGGWDIDLYYLRPNKTDQGYTDYVWFVHIHYEWFIFPADHLLTFYDSSGVSLGDRLSITEIVAAESDNTAKFRASCDHTTYHFTLAYNSTLYSSFAEAWDAGGVGAFCGVNFDQTNTSYNAMDLLGTLLFFGLPAETPILIKAILAIPLWAAVAYLTFIFVLRAIGAIFGGGA